MIQLNLANVVTIALAGMLGYGVLVALGKTIGMVKGQSGGGGANASASAAAIGPA